MIIYYAMTKFHLIFSITHKFRVHGNEEATLFLYSGLQDLETNYSRIKEMNIFSNVYIVPEIQFHKCWKPLRDNSSEKEIASNVDKMVAEIEEWLPIKFSDEDLIYIANDHWALGTYCILKGIPYIYYEDGVGMLSKPDYSYDLVKRVNSTHAIIAKYINAFGNNDCVIEKLADLNNQTEGFYDEKARHFSVKEQLKELSNEEITKLLYIFDAPNCGTTEDATVLLTEHFVNMKRLTIEGQRELYAMLVDFFSQGKTLYIKPHPNDFQISYVDIFPDAKIISRKFPSELLPYCFKNRLQLALAACSTSVFGLQDVVNNMLRFDIDIENHYMFIPKYFVVKTLLEYIKQERIETLGVYADILNALSVKFVDMSENSSGVEVCLVDKVDNIEELPNLEDKETLVYLNSSEDYKLFEQSYVTKKPENWNCIKIHKEIQDKNFVTNFYNEYVWVYTRSEEKKKLIKGFAERINMENTGMILDVNAITDDAEMKIKLLEGNLRAALNRIEKYKSMEKDYESEIEKLKNELAKCK